MVMDRDETVSASESATESTVADADQREGSARAGRKKGRAGSSRGIETMFRTSYRTQVDLTQISDNKANMMITVNGVILSAVVAWVTPQLGSAAWLLIPATVLLLGCLASLILAVRSARPRVGHEPVSVEDARRNRGNVLFFGNFVHLPRDEYVAALHELMENRETLYDNMSRDLYGLGTVLEGKSRELRASYTLFGLTLATAVAVFLVAFFFLAQPLGEWG